MPLENNFVLGTNEDGSKNNEYCNICFRMGKFTNPNLTLHDEMESVTLQIMSLKKISKDAAKFIVENTLPKLKRWQKQEKEQVIEKN